MPFLYALGSIEDKSDLVAPCQDPPNDSARFCLQKLKPNLKSVVCRKVGMTNISDKDISLRNDGESGYFYPAIKNSMGRPDILVLWIQTVIPTHRDDFKSMGYCEPEKSG